VCATLADLQRRKAEQEADPEYQSSKRQREIEQWRQEQLRSGAAESNPNFMPLGGAKQQADPSSSKPSKAAKAAAKAAKAAKQAAAAAAGGGDGAAGSSSTKGKAPSGVLNSRTKPDLEALSAGLPRGWRAMWDKSSGDVYYGNPGSRVRVWAGWSCWQDDDALLLLCSSGMHCMRLQRRCLCHLGWYRSSVSADAAHGRVEWARQVWVLDQCHDTAMSASAGCHAAHALCKE
jgi:hypothetical protein